jgi:chloride channel 7
VFRSAISLVVLVVEGTRGINFLFGVIIAVLAANFVGSVLGQDGVYESEIERDGNVFYLHFEPPRKLSTLTAEEVRVSFSSTSLGLG